jgi:membrane-associated protease RseP (regulator of RpoE activity)
MSFLLYDLSFLALFTLFVVIFLYKKRKELKKEGIIYLYRTKWGIELIDHIGTKYKKTLNFLKYISITIGYFLMGIMIYLLGKTVYLYVKYPQFTEQFKAPPLAPIIPYFPRLFGMKQFFPEFYFTYFIIAIAVVAIVHEFSHGIFSRLHKLKIKSTGIAFIGPILGAFVEPDEKKMQKLKKVPQLSILSAGVFANIIFSILFFLLLWLFFMITFVPSGATFNYYAIEGVNISLINSIGGISVYDHTSQGLIDIIDNNELSSDLIFELDGNSTNLTKITANNKTYFWEASVLKEQLKDNPDYLIFYSDMPAIKSGLKGTIIQINNEKITSYTDLSDVLKNYKPGDKTNIITRFNEDELEYNLILAEHTQEKDKPMIGVVNIPVKSTLEDSVSFFKEPFTEYRPNGEFLVFIYYLLFWLFLLNLLVAMFNMLPFASLDGGRFFYLTVWGITKNEKFAAGAYKWSFRIILFSFILLMVVWLWRIIPLPF